MIKMDNEIFYYWEVWFNDNEKLFYIHYGEVGKIGECITRKKNFWVNKDTVMEKLSDDKKSEGYSLLQQEELSEVMIQYKIEGGKEVSSELEKRYEIQSIMDEGLGWTGNGYCDGGDYGSGAMNIFCFVISIDQAIKTIIDNLEKNNLLIGATIAHSEEDDYISDYPAQGNIVSV